MWPFCSANSLWWLLLPFLIGLLAGWWAWARRPQVNVDGDTSWTAPVVDPPAVPLASVPEAPSMPDIPVAPIAAVAALTGIGIPAAIGDPDNLMDVKGIGPALNTLLNSLGVTRFDQIAAWGADDIGKVDGHLGAFKGRIDRDNWVEQAKLLASGARDEFERRFGTIGSEHQ
jgi:predicted flap endonuclease-1-like 5' DNA nuclease